MTRHKTKKMKWKEKRNLYRSEAEVILEVEPQPRYLIFIGQLIQALDEQCGLNDALMRKVERTILEVLKTWANFSMYRNLYFEIGREIGLATNRKIFVDIKRKGE